VDVELFLLLAVVYKLVKLCCNENEKTPIKRSPSRAVMLSGSPSRAVKLSESSEQGKVDIATRMPELGNSVIYFTGPKGAGHVLVRPLMKELTASPEEMES
jgi:hypothetical protein